MGTNYPRDSNSVILLSPASHARHTAHTAARTVPPCTLSPGLSNGTTQGGYVGGNLPYVRVRVPPRDENDSPAIVPRPLRRVRRPRSAHVVRADMPGDYPAWSLPPPRASCAVTTCRTYVPCTPAAAFARRTIVPRTSSPRTSPAPLVHSARSAFNTPLSSRRGPCCGFPRVGTSFAHAVQPVSSTCRSVQGTSDMSPNSCASDVRPSFILFCHHHAHLPPVRLRCSSAAPTHRARSMGYTDTAEHAPGPL